MADETMVPGTGAASQEGGAAPSVHAHAQYVKDLSFENPNPVETLSREGSAPTINVNCEVGVNRVSDNTFEVALSVEARAVRDEKSLFLVSLDYGGLFTLSNVPQQHVEPVLYVHCPTLLFPFVRQVVAEVTRQGGYAPLLLEMIDFATLFQRERAQQAQQTGGNGAAAGGGAAPTASGTA